MPKQMRLFLRSLLLSKPAITLSFLAASLAGCSASSIETAKSNVAYACALYGEGLTYSGTKDTMETIREIIAKNKAFLDAHCDLHGHVVKS